MAAAAGVLETVSTGVRNILELCEVSSKLDDVRDDVSSSGNGLLARLARPDTDRVATDGGLSAEGADVTGVLGDFHLLDLLTQGGTVSVGVQSVLFSLAVVYRIRIPIDVRLRRCCSMRFSPPSAFILRQGFPSSTWHSFEAFLTQSAQLYRKCSSCWKISGSTNLTPYLPVTPTYLHC